VTRWRRHVVGECLRVGEQQELRRVVLHLHACAQRADVVAEMQRAGGAVAGEDDRSGRVRHDEWAPGYRRLQP
jgi:hypothetical protein